jgi:hypothetical protein
VPCAPSAGPLSVRDPAPAIHRHLQVSFFETSIRALGGLLSAYELSKEKVFLEKALDLGERCD